MAIVSLSQKGDICSQFKKKIDANTLTHRLTNKKAIISNGLSSVAPLTHQRYSFHLKYMKVHLTYRKFESLFPRINKKTDEIVLCFQPILLKSYGVDTQSHSFIKSFKCLL